MLSRFLLAPFVAMLLSGCAAPALTIVQDKQFDMMNRHMHRELEKRGLLNARHGFICLWGMICAWFFARHFFCS